MQTETPFFKEYFIADKHILLFSNGSGEGICTMRRKDKVS